jgi:hypothetical protein
MADATYLVVDLDALQELGNRLALIHDCLTHYNDDVQAYGAAIGSARVQHQLDSFVSGWKDGRKKINDNVTNLRGKVEGVAQTYLEQEQAIVKQSQSSGPCGSGH